MEESLERRRAGSGHFQKRVTGERVAAVGQCMGSADKDCRFVAKAAGDMVAAAVIDGRHALGLVAIARRHSLAAGLGTP